MPTGRVGTPPTKIVPEEETKLTAVNGIPKGGFVVTAVKEQNKSVVSLGGVAVPERRNLNKDDLTYWIPDHIKRRECKRYRKKEKLKPREKSNPDDPLCGCGIPRSHHPEKALVNQGPEKELWDMRTHTEEHPTDSFGEVEFFGFSHQTSKYVRVAEDTQMDVMLELLQDQWKLKKPNLLISVTGGAQAFEIKPRLKSMFRTGLVKAADSTGGWIVTGGMNEGVMKYVGEAVREFSATAMKKKMVAIGIATWGCVAGKKSLTDNRPKGRWPGKYNLLEVKKKQQPGTSAIDPNHTHFIFVDDGSRKTYGREIEFRAALEHAISKQKTDESKDAVSIPIVCVLLEGGPGSIHTVHSAIQNQTPVVIVQGSGRAADIFAYAYNNSEAMDIDVQLDSGEKIKRTISVIDKEIEAKIEEKVKNVRGQLKHVGMVKESLLHRDMITVFNLGQDGGAKDIDLAILTALLTANKNQVMTQLRLALAWNRIDVAKSEIFEKRKWKPGELNDIFLTAIMQNKVDFVDLMMENGVSLKLFLTKRRLEALYHSIPDTCLLKIMLKDVDVEDSILDQVKNLLKNLLNEEYSSLLNGNWGQERQNSDEIVETDKKGNILQQFERPGMELFLFAVLMNWTAMSRLFWAKTENTVAAALLAEALLKQMEKETDDSELEEQIREHMEFYDQGAIGILFDCYNTDQESAEYLVVRQLPYFSDKNMLELAVEADNKAFLAHACCQSVLSKIWMGRMVHSTSSWRVWCCLFLPFLIPILITYREDDVEKRKKAIAKRDDTMKAKAIGKGDTEMEKIDVKVVNGNGRRASTVGDALFNPADKRKPKEERYYTMTSNVDIMKPNSKLRWYHRFLLFYQAVLVKFLFNCISYVAFLLLFSYIILTDFPNADYPLPSGGEIFLAVWVFVLLCEEMRQFIANDTKLSKYIRDVWNILDSFSILLFVVGVILRCIPNPDCLIAARVIFAVDLLTYFIRILHIFSIYKMFGVILVTIGKMMQDLLTFIVILLVFIIAYGMASQAILYPNSDLSWKLVGDVFHKAYWQMYGELFLEEIEGEFTCTSDPLLWKNDTLPRCVETKWAVPILLGLYILFSNILMFNLLIAMFSNTFTLVQEQAKEVWSYQRYFLIRDYFMRMFLPAPFVIIVHIYEMFKTCIDKCKHGKSGGTVGMKMIVVEEEGKRLTVWESLSGEEYLRHLVIKETECMEERVRITQESIGSLTEFLEEVHESTYARNDSGDAEEQEHKIPPGIELRFNNLEEEFEKTSKALNWIIKKLGDKATSTPPEIEDLREKKKRARERRRVHQNKQKARYERMFGAQVRLHELSLKSPYPLTDPPQERYKFNKALVPWESVSQEYEQNVVQFTAQDILDKSSNPQECDPKDPASGNIYRLNYNAYDKRYAVNRLSYTGNYRVDTDTKLPLNPRGRTGLAGRGSLPRWGPNFISHPVFTRLKKDAGKKKVLEFVAIQKDDQWGIPGTWHTVNQAVHQCCLVDVDIDETDKKVVKERQVMYDKGETVYKGYVDDPRNTDNAWLETVAVNYHDDDGDVLDTAVLKKKNDESVVEWKDLHEDTGLAEEDYNTLYLVALRHDCDFKTETENVEK